MAIIKLSENDRERVRYHLAFLNVEPVSSIALGFPSAQQAQFLVERAMDRVLPAGVPRVLRIVNHLDCIEEQMMGSLKHLKAQQIGELKLRNSNEEPTEQDLLEREYMRWALRLADQLGVPINPFSERFRHGLYGGGGMNTPVSPP